MKSARAAVRFVREHFVLLAVLALPLVILTISSARAGRHRDEWNQQARKETHQAHKKLQALRDHKLGVATGQGFRRFPMQDVTGAQLPRPGAGQVTLVVFGGRSLPMVSVNGWKELITQRPRTQFIAVVSAPVDALRNDASKVKQRSRMFLVADPQHLLHNMFNATQRAFVVARNGQVAGSIDLRPDGWRPKPDTLATINHQLKQLGG